MTISVRPALGSDAPFLPAIERSAGELFRSIADLAWLADGDDLPEARYRQLIGMGASWVAEASQARLVGFLCGEVVTGALHIWELDVAAGHQRQGIGRALLREAIAHAEARRLAAVTLTTFRAVPWNEPAYHRMGFETVPPGEHDPRIAGILEREVEAGLPPERRCAMCLPLGLAP